MEKGFTLIPPFFFLIFNFIIFILFSFYHLFGFYFIIFICFYQYMTPSPRSASAAPLPVPLAASRILAQSSGLDPVGEQNAAPAVLLRILRSLCLAEVDDRVHPLCQLLSSSVGSGPAGG